MFPSYVSLWTILLSAGPIVAFNQSEVFVTESESEITFATFALDRRGHDLNNTTRVRRFIFYPQISLSSFGDDVVSR